MAAVCDCLTSIIDFGDAIDNFTIEAVELHFAAKFINEIKLPFIQISDQLDHKLHILFVHQMTFLCWSRNQ
jgi:hypothetical protein